jgi:putative glutamine amidotransferase
VVLHGGGDIDPSLYGQHRTAENLYGINDAHDAVELAIVRTAVDLDLPMLAICRGLQMVNVALGGTLHQDLGTDAHTKRFHPVELSVDSLTAAAMGSTTAHACHSYHHQAIDRVAAGLTVTGRAADGTIEGVERPSSRWLVAVQWHPEDSSADDPQQQALFDELVRRARGTAA